MGLNNILKYLPQLNYDESICDLFLFKKKSQVLFKKLQFHNGRKC